MPHTCYALLPINKSSCLPLTDSLQKECARADPSGKTPAAFFPPRGFCFPIAPLSLIPQDRKLAFCSRASGWLRRISSPDFGEPACGNVPCLDLAAPSGRSTWGIWIAFQNPLPPHGDRRFGTTPNFHLGPPPDPFPHKEKTAKAIAFAVLQHRITGWVSCGSDCR